MKSEPPWGCVALTYGKSQRPTCPAAASFLSPGCDSPQTAFPLGNALPALTSPHLQQVSSLPRAALSPCTPCLHSAPGEGMVLPQHFKYTEFVFLLSAGTPAEGFAQCNVFQTAFSRARQSPTISSPTNDYFGLWLLRSAHCSLAEEGALNPGMPEEFKARFSNG